MCVACVHVYVCVCVCMRGAVSGVFVCECVCERAFINNLFSSLDRTARSSNVRSTLDNIRILKLYNVEMCDFVRICV